MGCSNSKRRKCPDSNKCKDNMVVFVPFSERDRFLEKDCSKAVLVYRMIREARPPESSTLDEGSESESRQQVHKPQKRAHQGAHSTHSLHSPRKKERSGACLCCSNKRVNQKRVDCSKRRKPCHCNSLNTIRKGAAGAADGGGSGYYGLREAQTQASCKARVSYYCESSEELGGPYGKGGHKNKHKKKVKQNETETQTRCQPKVVFVCKSFNGSSSDINAQSESVQYIEAPSSSRKAQS